MCGVCVCVCVCVVCVCVCVWLYVCVCVCVRGFAWSVQQTAILFVCSISWLVCVIETACCEVGTGTLNTHNISGFTAVTKMVNHRSFTTLACFLARRFRYGFCGRQSDAGSGSFFEYFCFSISNIPRMLRSRLNLLWTYSELILNLLWTGKKKTCLVHSHVCEAVSKIESIRK